MIKKITLLKNFTNYFPKTQQRVFEFDSGWNTLAGDNGTGKTTILNCIDRSGWPDGINQSSLSSVPSLIYKVEVERNTRVIRYQAEYVYQRDKIKEDFDLGIIGTDDFARFTFFRESRGQDAAWYFQHFLKLYHKELHDASSDIAVLIDEPENSLSLVNQSYFYKALRTWADQEHIQIISASHSPLLFHQYSDNVIELSPNYINRAEKVLHRLIGQKRV